MENSEVEILVVDDSMDDANLTIRSLKKNNVVNHLFHVKDGAEALDFIFAKGIYSSRANATKPKLILLDLKMPKVNGIEVLEKIKANPETRTIPVVILTSSQEDPDIQKCYKLGANSYITKPVDFEGFSKAIKEVGFYWMVLNRSNLSV
jgi:two-component system response regulator